MVYIDASLLLLLFFFLSFNCFFFNEDDNLLCSIIGAPREGLLLDEYAIVFRNLAKLGLKYTAIVNNKRYFLFPFLSSVEKNK